jgi:outer membrane biosynthesis protein TonB
MRWGLITSIALHAAILVAVLVVLPNTKPFEVTPTASIQVDISHIGEMTKKVATTTEDVPKAEKPAPKKAEPVKKAEPAPKKAPEVKKAVTEPKTEPPPPEPKKEEPKKAEADPLKDLIKDTVTDTPEPKKEEPKKTETKKAEVKPKDKPKKPDKPKPKLNPDEIAAFLNKTDEQKAAPDQTSDTSAQPLKSTVNSDGTDSELSATIVDAFIQKLKECWTVPPGAREANIVVQIHFLMNPDGSINGIPEIVSPVGDQLTDATARSAVSALLDCQNYDFLPKDRYDLWKDNTMNFNPNMLSNT